MKGREKEPEKSEGKEYQKRAAGKRFHHAFNRGGM